MPGFGDRDLAAGDLEDDRLRLRRGHGPSISRSGTMNACAARAQGPRLLCLPAGALACSPCGRRSRSSSSGRPTTSRARARRRGSPSATSASRGAGPCGSTRSSSTGRTPGASRSSGRRSDGTSRRPRARARTSAASTCAASACSAGRWPWSCRRPRSTWCPGKCATGWSTCASGRSRRAESSRPGGAPMRASRTSGSPCRGSTSRRPACGGRGTRSSSPARGRGRWASLPRATRLTLRGDASAEGVRIKLPPSFGGQAGEFGAPVAATSCGRPSAARARSTCARWTPTSGASPSTPAAGWTASARRRRSRRKRLRAHRPRRRVPGHRDPPARLGGRQRPPTGWAPRPASCPSAVRSGGRRSCC